MMGAGDPTTVTVTGSDHVSAPWRSVAIAAIVNVPGLDALHIIRYGLVDALPTRLPFT